MGENEQFTQLVYVLNAINQVLNLKYWGIIFLTTYYNKFTSY